MLTSNGGNAGNYLQRGPSPSGLADVLDVILDKGLVIDAYVRVSVIGIELVTIDARIVVASVDTYLRFAEAVNRLDLTETKGVGLPDLMEEATETVAEEVTESKLEESGKALRTAAKGAAAGALVAGVAAATKKLAERDRE
jgi:gas vesicle structural protein